VSVPRQPVRKRRGAAAAALLLLTASLLSACQGGQVQVLAGQVRAALFPPRPDWQRCQVSSSRAGDRLPGAVEALLVARGGGEMGTGEWRSIFEQAAVDAGVRESRVIFVLTGEQDGARLVAVQWCNYAECTLYDLYVIEESGKVWPVGQYRDLGGLVDVQWLDGAWIVVTIVPSADRWYQNRAIRIIGQGDDGWTPLYSSADGDDPLVFTSVEMQPVFVFEDGYRRLTVTWQDMGRRMYESTYEWRDGMYVLAGEVTLDRVPSFP
jgi:hypothetical protein